MAAADPILPPVWAEDVLRAVCAAFGVKKVDLLGLSRDKHLVSARHVAIWLLRVRPKPGQTTESEVPRRRSYPEVGRLIRHAHLPRMDHNSTIHACEQVAARAKLDPDFRAMIDRLAHDRPARFAPVAPPRLSREEEARRQRARWNAEVRAVLGDRPRPLRPVMELEEDDSDALARATGSLKLTAALADAGMAVRG